jgi:pyrroline-5-carboxylate reductase
MTVVSPLPEGCEREREIILGIFSSIGLCRFLDEKHFDACTALCGSGPAFVCVALEALADGGVMMGLPRAEALELAAQSEYLFFFFFRSCGRPGAPDFLKSPFLALQGTARMVLQTGVHPASIKDSVTSTFLVHLGDPCE